MLINGLSNNSEMTFNSTLSFQVIFVLRDGLDRLGKFFDQLNRMKNIR
jgi:hypothetical protein